MLALILDKIKSSYKENNFGWHKKYKSSALLIIDDGFAECDNIGRMVKYGKIPRRSFLDLPGSAISMI